MRFGGLAQQVAPVLVAPTADLLSEPGWLYHATNVERVYDIVAAGKLLVHGPSWGTDQDAWPDGSREKRAYFSANAGVVWTFAPEEGCPVVLRVRRDAVDARSERYTHDVYVRKSVPVRLLEVLAADGWRPVTSLT